MQVNIGQQKQDQQNVSGGNPQEGGTFIDWNNMKREREMLNKDGDVIDPRTKRIIKKNSDATS